MRWFLLVFIILSTVAPSPAQAPDDDPFKLTVDVDLVQLPVSVLDKHGIPVSGLRREHFKVYEDKVLQAISLFKQEDIPMSVGLVIDGSGSMRDKVDLLIAAATTFFRESNPADQRFVVSFGDEVFIDEDFKGDSRELNRAIAGIASNRGTALYDALFLAARHLQNNGIHEKKVLLLVSDGDDTASKHDLKEVLEAVHESQITVYSLGLLGSPFTYGMYGEPGKKVLKRLASETGGTSFFPDDTDDVEKICTRIARDLRNQYTIGYRPSADRLDGSWRKIQVRIHPPKNTPKVKVRTRQGYYASRSRAAVQKSIK